ncbi:hypothetical protein M0R45_036506 [Rubus argutus]|uniref:ZNF598/HEL2 PAH domain-containing protein n=1 Tax=Rubus argutus TaxID=59490 RepID=A0AAW1VW93_RUBAR
MTFGSSVTVDDPSEKEFKSAINRAVVASVGNNRSSSHPCPPGPALVNPLVPVVLIKILSNSLAVQNVNEPRSYASSAQAQVETRQTTVPGLSSSGSVRDSFNPARISHSASAPNLVENGSVQPSVLDFPPVSAAQVRKVPSTSQPTNQPVLKVGDVQTANKSLVEKIRAAVEFDEDKYNIFKDISGQYRQGLVDTEVYLDFVRQFGMLHLVLDLARLCPDAQKQRELIDAYNTSIRSSGAQENGWVQGSVRSKDSKKGKGKSSEAENSNSKGKSSETENSYSKATLADSIISSVRELQSNYRPSEDAVEMLSKDGYRAAKGKIKADN